MKRGGGRKRLSAVAEPELETKEDPGRVPEAETVPGFPGMDIGKDAAARKPSTMSRHVHQDLEAALSLERFARYQEWAGGDRARALEFYALNTRLSEALYTPLQMLEVVLRNRIHTVMSEARHDRWFEDEGFLAIDNQKRQLMKALEEVARSGREPTAGRVVASLTFSFWTSMLAPAYEDLWQRTLHHIARRENGKGLRRKDLSRPLAPIRTLRNRVAHHEPILQWDLPRQYANILQITRWLSPAAAGWCEQHSRFEEIYPEQGVLLRGGTSA